MVTSRIVLVLVYPFLSHGASENHNTEAQPCKDFKCQNNQCIPQNWKCDGYRDCEDGSDEYDSICWADCDQQGVFQCGGGRCIAMDSVCDGNADCPDGKDEPHGQCGVNECLVNNGNCSQTCVDTLLSSHCACTEGYKLGSDNRTCDEIKCDEEGLFGCGGGHCVAMDAVCDGKTDCPDGQDEPHGQCGVNECLVNNGNCSQTCVDTLTSYHCTCPEGYQLGSDNKTCEDIDECDIPGSCSQNCFNEYGTFSCECEDGYLIDPVDNRSCKAAVGNGSFILANKANILTISMDEDKKRTILVTGTAFASGLDFIYRTGFMFWSDNEIYRAKIEEGNARTDVIIGNDSAPNRLAVDWIYGHIYWTDYGVRSKPYVGVANLDGTMKKSLITDGVEKPSAIAVNPLEGWLFWCDFGEVTKIERAGLDGSHRQIIVSSNIDWPISLTLDLVKRRLYWADANLHVISSCEYDGSGRRQILHHTEALQHPFSITVFEDNLYFTNIKEGNIFRANKFNGSDVTPYDFMQNAMELKVYHPYTQPDGVNLCGPDNGNCSHLCLPAPQVNQHSPKTTCACPDGMFFVPGVLKCIDNATLAKMERTFIMVSPEGVRKGLVGDIIKKFESSSFSVVALKMAWLTEDRVKTYHADISRKRFFLGQVKNVYSGPVVAMVWEGLNVVNITRSMLETAHESIPGTVRGDLDLQTGRDIVYSSDSVESAKQEISLWFNESEIVSWPLA